MTFRTRLLLVFTAAVVASVALVEWLVTDSTRQAFQRMETQRANGLVAQFRKEFDERGQRIVRAVNGIARSEAAVNIAISADYAPYYNEAASLASAHGLGLLELVAGDGTIVSSAQWPARFGYQEEWLRESADWESRGAFLQRQELPDSVTVSLMAVGTASAGGRQLYVAGGQRLDREFLSSLVLPEGMRVLLYRNLEPGFSPTELVGGRAEDLPRVRPLIEQVQQRKRELSRTLGSGSSAETFHALPLTGYQDNLLGVLLIASSRRELVELESVLRRTGMGGAAAGILLGIALSWWATTRVT